MSGMFLNGIDIDVIKALGDETRIGILLIIGKKELNATEISNKCTLSRPTISHHLQILKRANILTARKEGTEIYYSIYMGTLKKLSRTFLSFTNSGTF
ncbi:MAG: winged helix-turn-helix transcriptional regulator [Peptostreptococcaceae bacterium]|nr:winged helix-turn-helix transcriptional regulator [Peptostreptococcaceae bacterium]